MTEITELCDRVLSCLQEINKEYSYLECKKANGMVLHGFSLKQEMQDFSISPVIYLESVNAYKNMQPSDTAQAIDRMMHEISVSVHVDNFNIDCLEPSKVFYKVYSAEMNKDFIDNPLCKVDLGLAFIPYFLVSSDSCGISSARITKELYDTCDSLHDLSFEAIKENTVQLFPAVQKSLSQVLSSIFSGDAPDTELCAGKDIVINVYTNNVGVNGAASALFQKEMLDDFERGIMIPSSIHEFIAIGWDGTTEALCTAADMLKEVNECAVEEDEILSYNILYFDRDKEIKRWENGTSSKGH